MKIKPKINICVPARGTINVYAAQCLFQAVRVLKQYDIKVLFDISFGIDNARNKLVESSSDADYLMFIDSDICFIPKDIRQLVNHNKDIVSGVYFKRGFPYHPHAYMLKKGTNGYEWVTGKLKGLQEVDAVGFGFILIKRTVFDKLKKPYFLTDSKNTIGEDIYWCYDKYTQIVTKNGIKFIKDVNLQDKILTLNSKNKMEYQNPIKTIKKKSNTILHFKSRRIDIAATEDQDLLVGYRMKEKNIYKPLTFVKASEINKKLWPRQCRYYIKKNGGIWVGKNLRYIKVSKMKYETKNFVKFLAWYLSEGHCSSQKNNYSIRITQYNQTNLNEIKNIIKNMGYNPKIYNNCILSFFDNQLQKYLKQFGKSHDKFIPNIIKNLSPQHLKSFLSTYAKGDGHVRQDMTVFFYTSSKKMKDDLIELILKTGNTFYCYKHKSRNATFSNGKTYKCCDMWQISMSLKNKERAYLRKAIEIKYNDYTYDLTVPNNTIYIIRNGKGCWSSNCKHAQKAGYKIYLDCSVQLGHLSNRIISINDWKKVRPGVKI